MKLTAKLPAIVVGAILITAITGSGLSILIGRNVLRQATLDENMQRVETYASAVTYYTESARSLLTTTAELPQLRTFAAAREVAALVLAHSDVFEYLTLLTPGGSVVMLEPRVLEERLSDRNLSFFTWFAEVRRTNRTVVSDLHISPATQWPTVVIATPVHAADGRTLGVWVGALKLSEISKIGLVAAGHSVTNGSSFVTDRRGLIIAHQTKPNYVENQTDFRLAPAVIAALAGKEGSGEFFNPIENEMKFAAYRPLRDLGWAAVHYVPVTSALALLDTPTRAILSASVALAALMGIGVFVSIRRSVAPLTRLTAAAQTVGTGDFSQRIEARSGDEIGELAAEFNRMAGALAEKDAQVRGHATELAHSNAELERANRELEAFTYSVSHDLRAPLRSVNSFSKVLLEDYADKLDDEGKDDLRRVYAATQRMGQLIDDLLKLSRIGRAEITVEAVDLSALARSVVAELKESDPARNVEFDIPPTADARGDKRLLTILLENLLGNAWKFTSKHESARIEFGVTTQDGAQVYFVRDDGAGFDMAYVDNLFAPFQRLHRAADFPGTGVGLATVGRIVEHHGGRVWAEGAVEQGATFYFTLAREPAAEAGAAGGKSRWRLQ